MTIAQILSNIPQWIKTGIPGNVKSSNVRTLLTWIGIRMDVQEVGRLKITKVSGNNSHELQVGDKVTAIVENTHIINAIYLGGNINLLASYAIVNDPGYLASNPTENEYADIDALKADQGNQTQGFNQKVLDPSGDPNAKAGEPAIYYYLGSNNAALTDYIRLSDSNSSLSNFTPTGDFVQRSEFEALDSEVVKKTGDQTIAGVKTFSSSPKIPDAVNNDEPVSKGQLDTAIAGVGGGTPTLTYYTSERGAVSDADVSLGSTSFGTDNLAVLQSLLDEALTHPIVVMWDGKYSISGALIIHSNTTIIGANGGGVILRNDSDAIVFKNANIVQPSSTGGYGSNIVDENIHIENLIINGNGYNNGPGGDSVFDTANGGSSVNGSAQTRNHMMFFVGVRNLSVIDCKLYAARLFSIQIKNVEYIKLHDIVSDHGAVSTRDPYNYDAIHFIGYVRFGDFKNINIQNNHDDAIAINADDAVADVGPITDLSFSNIILDNATYNAFRFLSTTQRIDRIYINNIKGDTTNTLVKFDIGNLSDGYGNIGTITIENIDAVVTRDNSAANNSYIYLKNTVIEKLILKNISRQDFSEAYPYIKITGANSRIKQLSIDGVHMETSGGTWNTPFLDVQAGIIDQCFIGNIQHLEQNGSVSAPIVKVSGGTIIDLLLDNIIASITNIVNHTSGTLTSILANNIKHKNGSSAFATTGVVTNLTLSNYIGVDADNIISGDFTNKKGSTFNYLGIYTTADFPNPVVFKGSTIHVTDTANGSVQAFSNGVNWIDMTNGSIIAGTVPTILLQDDFTGETINTSKWTVAANSSVGITQNDKLIFTDLTTASNITTAYIESAFFDSTIKPLVLKWDSKKLNASDSVFRIVLTRPGGNSVEIKSNLSDSKCTVFEEGVLKSDVSNGMSITNSFKIKIGSGTAYFYHWNNGWQVLHSYPFTDSSFKISIQRTFESAAGEISEIDNLYIADGDFTTLNP